MEFFCIADEDTVRGFRLAGVAGQAVTTPQQAAAALAEASSRPECALIILTQELAATLRPQLEAIRLERAQPLIVEIPGPSGPLAGHKSLRLLVQEAVGLRLDHAEGG